MELNTLSLGFLLGVIRLVTIKRISEIPVSSVFKEYCVLCKLRVFTVIFKEIQDVGRMEHLNFV